MANAKCRSCDHADDAVLTAETGIRLLGVARNPANGFPARLLDAVDMESYRMERRAAQSISLAEEDAEIAPVQPTGAGGAQEPEMDRLSNMITEFNKTWGGKFSDPGRVSEVLNRKPEQVLEDQQYQNARKTSGRQNAQIELDSALRQLVTSPLR